MCTLDSNTAGILPQYDREKLEEAAAMASFLADALTLHDYQFTLSQTSMAGLDVVFNELRQRLEPTAVPS